MTKSQALGFSVFVGEFASDVNSSFWISSPKMLERDPYFGVPGDFEKLHVGSKLCHLA